MKFLKGQLGHEFIALGAVLALSVLFFIIPISRGLEYTSYDFRMGILRGGKLGTDVRVISIDQQSLNELGGFPWKRNRYAELIDNIKGKNPGLLIFDILFQEPKKEDSQFAESIKNAGFPVLLPYCFSTEHQMYSGETFQKVPVTGDLKKAGELTGFIDNTPDPDGIFRRVQLAIKYKGKYEPGMDLVAFAKIKGVAAEDIKYERNRIVVGDTIIPTDENHYMLIDFYIPRQEGGIRQTFPVRSFYKFLNPENIPDLNKAILIVGIGTPGMHDDFKVPHSPVMYGAVIHANVINTMMEGSFIRETPEYLNFIVVIILAVLYGFFFSRSANVKKLIITSVSVFVGFTVINLILFKSGIWLYWVQPVFVMFTGTLVVSTLQFFRTHKIFGQFVAKEMVDQMVESDEHTRMGGVEKEVSILFSDIRGYTTLSEKLSPSEVMNMLNEYHEEMVKIFHKHYGRVFDYQGDAQMVVFGAPIEREDHAHLACKAALDMDKALSRLREKWKVEKRELFEIGVGICTGVVAIGLVGAEGHKQYSAIGDATNVAARLQGKSKILGASILISPATYEYIKDIMTTRSLGETELKGKSKPMEVFTVIKEKEK